MGGRCGRLSLGIACAVLAVGLSATAAAGAPSRSAAPTISPLDLAKSALKASLSTLTSGVYIGAAQPGCSSSGSDAARVAWAPSASRALLWCHGRNGDGSETVKVVNNKRYAVVVTFGGGLQKVSGTSDGLSAQFSNLLNRSNQITLAPGGTAQFRAPLGTQKGTIDAEYDGFAQSLTSLLTAADVLSYVASQVPLGRSIEAKQFLQLLDLTNCFRAAGIDPRAAVSHAVETVTGLVNACFGDAILKKVFKKAAAVTIGATVGTLAGLINYFWSSGQALLANLRNDTRYAFAIAVDAPAAPAAGPEVLGVDSTAYPVGSSGAAVLHFRAGNCDVVGGTWYGSDGSSHDFGNGKVQPVPGGVGYSCAGGQGSFSPFTVNCGGPGRWIEAVVIRDAAGRQSPRFTFVHSCG